MLPREHRLPSPHIKSVMRAGRRANGEGVSLIYRKRDDALNATERKLDPRPLRQGFSEASLRGDDKKRVSRFAFVVPMTADKRAVARNRLKRLVRESVRLALPHLTTGWDGVLMVRRGLGTEFRVVDLKIRELLKKSTIL